MTPPKNGSTTTRLGEYATMLQMRAHEKNTTRSKLLRGILRSYFKKHPIVQNDVADKKLNHS